jgi:uncharacterized protein YjbJ (UPF0337 family)
MSDTYTAQPDLAGKAKDIVRDVKSKAADLTDGVTRAAKENASQLGDAAINLAGTARDKVESAFSQQKSVGADYIASIAQAADRAAGEFDNDLPQAAQYIRMASEQIQGIADTVRERDVRELVGEVQDFARRQPTLFFGGAVILGFAALRFLKSAAPAAASAAVSTAASHMDRGQSNGTMGGTGSYGQRQG